MNTNWNHKELLVADFINRSRYARTNKTSCYALSPNKVLGSIAALLLSGILFFLFNNSSDTEKLVAIQNPLANFLPSEFVLNKNLSIGNGYIDKYARSATQMQTFIYTKIINHKLNKEQAHKIATMIMEAGRRTGLDPILIAAICKAESGFNINATSQVGAAGLMQLMPATAKYIGKKLGLEPKSKKELYDMERNLILGSAYFVYLNKMFHGNVQRSLVAYNWGPANAELAFYKRVRNIPTVTQIYTRKVISTQRSWKSEYQQKAAGFKFASNLSIS